MTPSVSYGPALQRVIDEGIAARHAALLERVTVLERALEEIASLTLPYRDTANLARHIAKKALDGS